MLLWLFFICFNLYLWNVLTLGENAEAFLSCPTSSSLPGTTGQQFQCQHACLWCMVIYFCCMFIYLIKICVGKYAMVFHSFQRYLKNVTTSTTGGCGWLYFLLFLPFGILLMFVLIYRSFLRFVRSVALVGHYADMHLCRPQFQGFERTWQWFDRRLHILV